MSTIGLQVKSLFYNILIPDKISPQIENCRRSGRQKKPNKAYAEFQETLKKYEDCGILSPVKNDPDEFVDKLNSPVKKKSTIFGHFQKVAKEDESDSATPDPKRLKKELSPEVEETAKKLKKKAKKLMKLALKNSVKGKEEEPSPKIHSHNTRLSVKKDSPITEKDSPILKKRRSKLRKNLSFSSESLQTPENSPLKNLRSSSSRTPLKEVNPKIAVETPSTLRPRRSCTQNVSYKTPEKLAESPDAKKLSEKRAKIKTIVVDDDNEADESTPQRKPKKLAPIFLPKPVMDPKVVQAKKDFLQSGLPQAMIRERDEQKIFLEQYEEPQLFPEISHVGYVSCNLPEVNWKESKFVIREVGDNPELDTVKKFKYK